MAEDNKAVVSAIGTLLEAVPESEQVLREQLQNVLSDCEPGAVQMLAYRYAWQRTVQLLGNRVLELKDAGQQLPEWVGQATAITREYGSMLNASTTGE